jgi:hypothetical protein
MNVHPRRVRTVARVPMEPINSFVRAVPVTVDSSVRPTSTNVRHSRARMVAAVPICSVDSFAHVPPVTAVFNVKTVHIRSSALFASGFHLFRLSASVQISMNVSLSRV